MALRSSRSINILIVLITSFLLFVQSKYAMALPVLSNSVSNNVKQSSTQIRVMQLSKLNPERLELGNNPGQQTTALRKVSRCLPYVLSFPTPELQAYNILFTTQRFTVP